MRMTIIKQALKAGNIMSAKGYRLAQRCHVAQQRHRSRLRRIVATMRQHHDGGRPLLGQG